MGRNRADEYFECPHCGANVLVSAKFCRECGADDQSGWSDDGEHYDSEADAEDDFNYDEFVQREFPDQAPPSQKNLWLVVLIVVLCLAMLGLLY